MLRKKRACRVWALLIAIGLVLLPSARAGNPTITINTSFDTNNFFGQNPQALVDLNNAAAYYESILNANLSTINATAQSTADDDPGGDTWSTNTFNPSDPNNGTANIQISNLVVPTNTIIIFAGGGNLAGGSELGLGGPGGDDVSGVSQTWIDTVGGRGNPSALGNTPTTFAPWGGSVSFSNSNTANWYFGMNISGITNMQNDFYSVALHEIGHVLGIGTAPAWMDQITSGNFTGSHAEALNGGEPVPLSPDLGHWAQSSESDVLDTNTGQQPVMTPSILTGTRKLVTDLDAAGLEDIGWQVVPEPAVWPWAVGAGALGLGIWRRKMHRAVA
jgi:hypothetical protein